MEYIFNRQQNGSHSLGHKKKRTQRSVNRVLVYNLLNGYLNLGPLSNLKTARGGGGGFSLQRTSFVVLKWLK